MEKSLCQIGCVVMIETAIVCSQTCTGSLEIPKWMKKQKKKKIEATLRAFQPIPYAAWSHLPGSAFIFADLIPFKERGNYEAMGAPWMRSNIKDRLLLMFYECLNSCGSEAAESWL